MHNTKHTTRTARKKKDKGAKPFRPQTKHAISRSMPNIIPDEFDTRLRFRKDAALTGAAGAGFVKLTPNAAYDVDPSLGSTETMGFDEFAAFYSYYRVISYSYTIQVANSSTTTPADIYVLNTNTDPTLAGTSFSLYATNPYSQTKLLSQSPASGSRATFRGHHQVAKILGSKVVETDDNYRALTTANPSDLIWLTMIATNVGVTGGDANINLSYIIDVTMSIRFYGREVDLTLAAMKEKIQKLEQSRLEHRTRRMMRRDSARNMEKL